MSIDALEATEAKQKLQAYIENPTDAPLLTKSLEPLLPIMQQIQRASCNEGCAAFIEGYQSRAMTRSDKAILDVQFLLREIVADPIALWFDQKIKARMDQFTTFGLALRMMVGKTDGLYLPSMPEFVLKSKGIALWSEAGRVSLKVFSCDNSWDQSGDLEGLAAEEITEKMRQELATAEKGIDLSGAYMTDRVSSYLKINFRRARIAYDPHQVSNTGLVRSIKLPFETD